MRSALARRGESGGAAEERHRGRKEPVSQTGDAAQQWREAVAGRAEERKRARAKQKRKKKTRSTNTLHCDFLRAAAALIHSPLMPPRPAPPTGEDAITRQSAARYASDAAAEDSAAAAAARRDAEQNNFPGVRRERERLRRFNYPPATGPDPNFRLRPPPSGRFRPFDASESGFFVNEVINLETSEGTFLDDARVNNHAHVRAEQFLLPGARHVVLSAYALDDAWVIRHLENLRSISGNLLILTRAAQRGRGGGILDFAEAAHRKRIAFVGTGGRQGSTYHAKFILAWYPEGLRFLLFSHNLNSTSESTTDVFFKQGKRGRGRRKKRRGDGRKKERKKERERSFLFSTVDALSQPRPLPEKKKKKKKKKDHPYRAGLQTFKSFPSIVDPALLAEINDSDDNTKVLCAFFKDDALSADVDDKLWVVEALLSTNLQSMRGKLFRSSPTRAAPGEVTGLEAIAELVRDHARLRSGSRRLAAVVTTTSLGSSDLSQQFHGQGGETPQSMTDWARLAKMALLGRSVNAELDADAEARGTAANALLLGGQAAGPSTSRAGASANVAAAAAAAAGAADAKKFLDKLRAQADSDLRRLRVQVLLPNGEDMEDMLPNLERSIIRVEILDFLRGSFSFYRWTPEQLGRVIERHQTYPHCKMIIVTSDAKNAREGPIYYLIFGSHNFSKAALGFVPQHGTELEQTNFELSIFLCPALEEQYRAHPHSCYDIGVRRAEEAVGTEEGLVRARVARELRVPEEWVVEGLDRGTRLKQWKPQGLEFWTHDAVVPEANETAIVRFPIPHDVPARRELNVYP